ncbi:hypothetical protein AX16_004833 [Volvariella volvacea WC 439]|nr:hypothetical protein AX16_004833 [Volvariella volvacea WC 439]
MAASYSTPASRIPRSQQHRRRFPQREAGGGPTLRGSSLSYTNGMVYIDLSIVVRPCGNLEGNNTDVQVLSQASIINRGNIINNVNGAGSVSPVESAKDKLSQRMCPRAMFNGDTRADAPKCHEETRKSILADIKHWGINFDEKTGILWLKGPVGTGKSAIARRVCEDLNNQDPCLLAGSFFFWRNDPDRNSLKSFVATIAYRLCVVMQGVERMIEEALIKDPSILESAIEYQWTVLVIKPLCQALSASQSSHRSLIVIDGLDECGSPTNQELLLDLLVKLRQYAAQRGLDQQIAFLVASRPEAHIKFEIESIIHNHPFQFRLPHLSLTETKESREDMRLILTTSFNDIYRRRRAFIDDRQWPPAGTIEHIINLAKGQFIYPLTIVRWLREEDGHPVQRLRSIFDSESCDDQKARALAPLDNLYDHILSSACSKEFSSLVLPCLFVITNPLPQGQLDTIRQLSHLFDKDPGSIRLALQPLHSVIRIPDDNHDLITIYHTSFKEYLHDKARSRGYYARDVKVLSLVFLQALKWASGDRKPTERSVAMWLNIPLQFSIEVTPPLLDALAQLNATVWLRERYALAPLRPSQDHVKKQYIQFRRWLVSAIPKTDQTRIMNNFPPAVGLLERLRFSEWEKDLRAGRLTPRQTVLFVYAIFALELEEFDLKARKKLDRDIGRKGLSLMLDTCHRYASFLPEEKHECKARELVLNEQKWLGSVMQDSVMWKSFLDFLLSYWSLDKLDNQRPLVGLKLARSMFGSLDILQSIVVDEEMVSWYLRYAFWLYLDEMRAEDALVRVNRQSLAVLQRITKYATRCGRSHSQKFGDLVPQLLVTHWENEECLPFPEAPGVDTEIEGIKIMYPLEPCTCDANLGLHLSGNSRKSTPPPHEQRNSHRPRPGMDVNLATISTPPSTPKRPPIPILRLPSEQKEQPTKGTPLRTPSTASPLSAVSPSSKLPVMRSKTSATELGSSKPGAESSVTLKPSCSASTIGSKKPAWK